MVVLPFFMDVGILGELAELLRLNALLILVDSHPFARNANGWGTETVRGRMREKQPHLYAKNAKGWGVLERGRGRPRYSRPGGPRYMSGEC
jgi:hypothetical protein